MKKIIVISGATASGKTSAAVDMCKKENGEIVSCDSRQVYKYLDVGANKEGVLLENGLREISGIVQHITDLIEPSETYSAAEFVRDADAAIEKIAKKGKTPIVAGGTGFYIKALLYGLNEMPAADENLRKELKLKTAQEQYDALLKLDPQSAQKNEKNPQRLLRALEVNILSGKTMSEHFKPTSPRYDFKHYCISVENKILYERINKRCENMFLKGMIEETQKVLQMGFEKNCPALSAIGYRHIVRYLDGEISKNEALEKFSRDTRHYAKRQNTWFRRQPDTEFIKGF
ncbi:MAG: tRNA (adenosine(37)-N6)-dimethylallyltransferase MiaA [Endomicrobium sp.]|nr:tRNA (adenosine(37)-N6)-dimethylallyltransferase MiaA [Endomicrobium sp.]